MKAIFVLWSLVLLFEGISQGQTLATDAATTTTDSQNWSEGSTGHYVKKPSRKPKKKAKRAMASEEQNAHPEATQDTAAAPIQGPVVNRISVDPVSPAPTPSPTPQVTTFGEGIKNAVLGGDENLIEYYKTSLDRQDIRRNIIETTITGGYLYNASSSSYYFKNYNDSGPMVGLLVDMWLSPFFGVDAEYKTTLLNEVSDSPTQNLYTSTTQSWFNFGFKFRRFFGSAANASSIAMSLRYTNYQMSVPQSSLSRAKLQNQGPELDIDASLSAGKESFWTMGLVLQPFDSMSESLGAAVKSGNSNQTVGFGADVGFEHRFAREMTAFVKLTTLLYKTDFSGAASTVDPVTSATPSNVPVTNIFYFFDLGLRFGY